MVVVVVWRVVSGGGGRVVVAANHCESEHVNQREVIAKNCREQDCDAMGHVSAMLGCVWTRVPEGGEEFSILRSDGSRVNYVSVRDTTTAGHVRLRANGFRLLKSP